MTDTDPGLPPFELALAQQLCAKLCHDLGGPLGTLAGMVDLIEPGAENPEVLDLAREAADQLRQRLRLQVAAWGGAEEEAAGATLGRLLQAAPAAARVRFRFDTALNAAIIPAAVVPLILNGALLAADALPRGGTVHVSGDMEELVFWPEGVSAAWPPHFVPALAGDAGEAALRAGPRYVLIPLLLAQADQAGFVPAFGLGSEPAPLILTRQT